MAACAIACSLCARSVGSLRRAACSAGPSPATLPWPKIAHTPPNRGCVLSPETMNCADRKRTTASAIVVRTVAKRLPLISPFAIYHTQTRMLEIAQFGAGRIGQIHASNIAAMKDVRLRYIVDVNAAAAKKLAARHGAKVAAEREAFADREV